MAGKEELTALLERVQKATGPDREIDADLAIAMGLTSSDAPFGIERGDDWPTMEYTASLDAITALIERQLPGWAWKTGTCSVSDDAWLVPDFNSPVHGERLRKEFGYPHNVAAGSIWDAGIDVDRRPSGHPALAMCAAFLQALIAQVQA